MKFPANLSHGRYRKSREIALRLLMTLCSLSSFVIISDAGSHWR